jgi:hypothetical protein
MSFVEFMVWMLYIAFAVFICLTLGPFILIFGGAVGLLYLIIKWLFT